MNLENYIENKKIPLVTVAIPCFNHENFVEQSIRSVINQDYLKIELMIIDDGSIDSSTKKIRDMIPYCKERFTRFDYRFRENKGVCETLNEILEWSSGDYFSVLASDDLIKPNKISKQVKYLELNRSVIGVFGGIEVLTNTGNKYPVLTRSASYKFEDIILLRHNLPAVTQLIRTEKIKNIGGFDTKLLFEDWPMWLSLTENGGTLDYVGEIFAEYRRHDGNISNNFEKIYIAREQVLRKYKNNKFFNLAKARSKLLFAIDVQSNNRVKSVKYLIESFFINNKVVFSKIFIKYMMRFFGFYKNDIKL